MLEDIFKLGLVVSFIDEITRPLKKTTRSLSNFEKRVVALNEKFKKMTVMGTKIATGAFGVASAISAEATAAATFSKQMAEVSTLVDTSSVNMAQLRNRLLEVAPAIGMDTSTATRALYNIISAGVKASDALYVLKMSGKAAVAGVTDVNTAATIGTQIMNAYSMSVKDLPHIYDLLFMTVKSGVTTFPELAQYLGDVLASASAAKVPLEQVMAAIAGMTKAGIKTPEATTALKGLLVALAAPSSLAAKKLHALGGEEFDAAISAGNLVKALEILSSKVHSLADVRAIIPDERAAKAFLSLSQHIRGFVEGVNQMKHSGGAMEEAFKKMAATTAFAWEQTKSALHGVAITIGMTLLPSIRSLALWLYKALLPLQKFILAHQKLAKAILLPLGVLSLFGLVVGSFLATVGIGGTIITHAIVGYRNLADAYDTLKTKLVSAVVSLKEFIVTTFASLRASIAAEGGILAYSRAIGVSLLESLRAAIISLRSFAAAALSSPIGWIGMAIAVAALLIYKYWQPIKAFFEGVFEGISEALQPIAPLVRRLLYPFKLLWSAIKSVFGIISSIVRPVHSSASELNRLGNIGKTVGHLLAYAFMPIIGPIKLIAHLIDMLKSKFESLKNLFTKPIKLAFNISPIHIAYNAFSRLVNFVKNINLKEAGKKLVHTFTTGIIAVAKAPYNALRSVLAKIRRLLPFSPAKEGPLADLNRIKIVQTIAEAIRPEPLINRMKELIAKLVSIKPAFAGLLNFRVPTVPDLSGRVKWEPQTTLLNRRGYQNAPISITLRQNINITGNADKETVKQIGQISKEAVKRAIEEYFYNKERVAW